MSVALRSSLARKFAVKPTKSDRRLYDLIPSDLYQKDSFKLQFGVDVPRDLDMEYGA